MNTKMITERERYGVRYKVVRRGKVVWERFESFSAKGRNRAGGPAFQEAAREQERIAGLRDNRDICK